MMFKRDQMREDILDLLAAGPYRKRRLVSLLRSKDHRYCDGATVGGQLGRLKAEGFVHNQDRGWWKLNVRVLPKGEHDEVLRHGDFPGLVKSRKNRTLTQLMAEVKHLRQPSPPPAP